ncbi:hypothetical protein INR49_027164 [Caranx melampygus]|nr:hypothetical protein INR49_027164 [Caranx melampygus]
MASAATEETPAPSAESDAPAVETNDGNGEEKDTGLTEAETEEADRSIEPKMEEEGAQAGEDKPAETADKAASEAVTHDRAVAVNQEATSAPEEAEPKAESEQSSGGGNSEPAAGNMMKEAKEEPAEDRRCSGIDCEKSKPVCEDSEKPSGGGTELGDKRRPSVEISSSDGEPLSRMDSEDSISSTLMEMESMVFVCLWKGCKVYNTPSTSQSWLQRHMLTHSGDKPFKCVVGGCNASFASQGGLARHVPSHFSQQSSSKMSSQAKLKEESPSKAGLNKRKKLKNKRRCSLPRPHDFFDAQTMDAIRHRAICLNLATHIESVGNGHSVVFHSTTLGPNGPSQAWGDGAELWGFCGVWPVGLLTRQSNSVMCLPEGKRGLARLPDVWVNETERCQLKTKVVHLSQLPQDTAILLDPNIYRALPQKRLKRSL